MIELEVNEVALRSRIGSIESRLLEIEKRLNMPASAYPNPVRFCLTVL